MRVPTIMRDHPGWATTSAGAVRVIGSGRSIWLWTCDDVRGGIDMVVVGGPRDGPAPEVLRVAPPPRSGTEIESALASVGPLLRVRNTDLWDALGTAILSQVVGAEQARAMYRRFCAAGGDLVHTAYRSMHLFPDPQCVLRLSARAFSGLEMSFTRRLLRAAATAYSVRGKTWFPLSPQELVTALRSIPGIGPWTAGVAAADYTGDFSVYPYADRFVRAGARRAAPLTVWPASEAAFRSHWRALAGDDVSALTQLTLAWGQSRSQPTVPDLPEPVDRADHRGEVSPFRRPPGLSAGRSGPRDRAGRGRSSW